MSAAGTNDLGPLFDSFPDGVLIVDEAGSIVAANGRARLMLGLGDSGGGGGGGGGGSGDGTGGGGGRSVLDLFISQGEALELKKALEDGGLAATGRVVEAEVAGPEGDAIQVAFLGLTSEPWPDRRVLVLRDVSAERRAEQVRVNREKLAAIGHLAAGVAHEFNNIMTSLYGFAQLTHTDPQFHQDLVAAVESYAERSREITRRLKSFSVGDTGPYVEVSVPELVDAWVARSDSELRALNISVARRYEPNVPSTLLSRRGIEEVLENLFANAQQAIVKNGTITIVVRVDGPSIVLRFSDTGYGIPKEAQGRVFEPFFTLKQAFGGERRAGAGLGLAVVYNRVRQHGGEITVESELGKGTTFTIRLPIRAERRRRQGKPPTSPGGVERRHERGAWPAQRSRLILAIDDEDHILRLLTALLEEHVVVSARDGREAVTALKKGPYDYVILDIILPGELDGFHIFDEISRREPRAKIIIITGREEDDRLRDYAARAYAYLRKPIDIKDIKQLIL